MSHADDSDQPEPTEPEAAEEGAAPAEPDQPAAEQQAEAERSAEETAAEPRAEPGEQSEAAPALETPAAEKKSKKPDKEVVPGANLEPIAITEERELTAEERARLEAEEEERASREAVASDDDDEELPRRATITVPTDATIRATGKRKSSVARVMIRAGDGMIRINGRGLDDYFPRAHHQSMARQPLLTAGYDSSVDVTVRVHGGGIAGQAGAVRHGIARALVELDPELRADLKKRGLLTRDARAKERRKAGLKKARKRPQFSKR
jgi:small subunit ribosomal protein S9